MIVTIFRSRINPDIDGEYDHLVKSTSELVETAVGFKSHKMFIAEDGERVTIVEIDSVEAQRSWAISAEPGDARRAGRARLYAEYKIQICDVKRESSFVCKSAPAPVLT